MDNGQKVITLAHPEHSSGELKSVNKQCLLRHTHKVMTAFWALKSNVY